MSTNDYILNLLNIKANNIFILNNIEEKVIKNKNYKVIEGKNNLIKSIKRIAFGYRKYDHFVARIFLISSIIKG